MVYFHQNLAHPAPPGVSLVPIAIIIFYPPSDLCLYQSAASPAETSLPQPDDHEKSNTLL